MASELGDMIRNRRHKKSIGLRELARRIDKSPGYIVSVETSETPPGISEETLAAIAHELELDPDVLLTAAGKTPQELTPRDPTDLALYRLVRALPEERKEQLREELEDELKQNPPRDP